MARTWSVVLLAAAVVACGVPQPKYEAALAETSRAIRQVGEEKQRAEAAEKKVAELGARLAAAEGRANELSARLVEQEQLAAAAGLEVVRQRAAASYPPPAQPAYQAGVQAVAPRAEPRAEPQVRSVEYQAMVATLNEEIRAGRIQVGEQSGRLTVRLAERVLFATGSATVSSDGRRTLRQVAEILKRAKGRSVRVEGHTDNIPIRTEAFPSNWELSSARAVAVMRALQEQGINPSMLSGAGYADNQPIASNDTSEGRAQNRRIDITLAAASAPAQPSALPKNPMIFPIPPDPGGGSP